MEGIEAEQEETIKMIKSFTGPELSDSEILEVLSQCENRVDLAVFRIIEKLPPDTVRKTLTSTGVRVAPQVNEENCEKTKGSGIFDGEKNVKMSKGMDFDSDVSDMNIDNEMSKGLVGRLESTFRDPCEVKKRDNFEMCMVKESNEIENKPTLKEEGSKLHARDNIEKGDGIIVKKENCEESHIVLEKKPCFQSEKLNIDGKVPSWKTWRRRFEEWLKLQENTPPQVKEESSQEVEKSQLFARVKEEPNVGGDSYSEVKSIVKQEGLSHGMSVAPNMGNVCEGLVKKEVEEVVCVQPLSARPIPDDEYYRRVQMGGTNGQSLGMQKQNKDENKMLSTVVIEDGDFPEESDWLLVGRNVIMGLSTTKGRKIENNEIVHIAFPTGNMVYKSDIVRFSTKRNGEVTGS